MMGTHSVIHQVTIQAAIPRVRRASGVSSAGPNRTSSTQRSGPVNFARDRNRGLAAASGMSGMRGEG